ncbi:MAG TPA: amidohydrolase [Pyrinomonadaceae bacterium]|nr:amidohydrolase [Pyrinomonadaceae bacterium]
MKILFVLIAIVTVSEFSVPQKIQPADLVLKNGNIYTVDDQRPHAEAVAVNGDRITFVGSNREIEKYIGPKTQVIDLKGETVFPGLTDAHHHLEGVGFREMTLNLEGVTSLQDLLAKVKVRVDQAKPGEWVTGRGWIETFWQPPVFPTRWDLDKVAPANPVVLGRADGHGTVVNSAALKIAGIDKSTPNPFGGEISKDKQTGEPNGMLLDAAQNLVRSHVPAPTAADNERAVILGVKRDIGLGWTQVQNPGGTYADIALDSKLFSEGKIKLRIYKALSAPGDEAQRLLREGPIVGKFGNRLTVRSLKLYADGSLGSRSAALLAPYSDAPDTSGFLTIKEETLQPILQEALRKGIQIETHAIGDRGNRFIIDQYEKAMRAVPKSEWKIQSPRWRVEHSQIVNPVDIPRFAQLGIIPSMQASHAIGDLHFAPARLGMERLKGAYAWQSFVKAGSIIPGGSDAPVERGEPMIEFYAAVARKDIKGFSGEGWHPEEALSREQAIKMFTIWAAYGAFEEDLRGSIAVGKLADFTVLSADIMKIPEAEILKTRCLMTIIGGEVVYEAK